MINNIHIYIYIYVFSLKQHYFLFNSLAISGKIIYFCVWLKTHIYLLRVFIWKPLTCVCEWVPCYSPHKTRLPCTKPPETIPPTHISKGICRLWNVEKSILNIWCVLSFLSIYEEGNSIIFGLPKFRLTFIFTLKWPGFFETTWRFYTATKTHLHKYWIFSSNTTRIRVSLKWFAASEKITT